MKRYLPAPLLSAILFALWLLLNPPLGAASALTALVVALAIPVVAAPLRPRRVRVRRPVAALKLVARVAVDVLVSNAQVARAVLRAGSRPPAVGFVTIPLSLNDPNGLAALAVITTIVPGTIWCELAPDRSALRLHVFELHDEAAFVADFKARYERPLMEIFA